MDLYIQPSFHEGLPRALIEAMSRGLPALASNAGGSEELLAPAYIHQKGDAQLLSKQIFEMLNNPQGMEKAAKENFVKAQDYSKDVLMPRRADFWAAFKSLIKTQKKGV